MTTLPQRQHLLALIDAAVTAVARTARACAVVGLTARTLQRWRRTPAQGDRRPERVQAPPYPTYAGRVAKPDQRL